MQYRRPEPSRYQMLERKEGLGVRTSKKKENLVMCEPRGEERLSSEPQKPECLSVVQCEIQN